MFIKRSQSGYSRHGEQFARGSFLLVFSHNSYKWEEQNNRAQIEHHGKVFEIVQGNGFVLTETCRCKGTDYRPFPDNPHDITVPAYYTKYCPVHGREYKTMPSELTRKLYACVRHVSLKQFGHFMMGTARIGGQSITVSGSYGSDGLTRDYEELTLAAREHLVELPFELAEEFWKGGGHNTCGSEAPAMRTWALKTFRPSERTA